MAGLPTAARRHGTAEKRCEEKELDWFKVKRFDIRIILPASGRESGHGAAAAPDLYRESNLPDILALSRTTEEF